MICICSEFLCRENLEPQALQEYAQVPAERLKAPRVGDGQSIKAFLSKGNWNKSNERKYTFSHFDTNVRKLYF